MKSRLGDPAPQARSGAARFAAPAEEAKKNVVTLKRQDVEALKIHKQPMTIRLTPEGIDRLAEIERFLRRAGVRARQASASEIVEALLASADLEKLRDGLPRG